MFVAFEGQDGAGKTTVLAAVHAELERRYISTVVVEEFSESPYGQALIEAVARDKFLRPSQTEAATNLTRALEEVIDLYYLDERIIGPALTRGQVVLKDRYCDTVLYTLGPALVDAGVVSDEDAAFDWLRSVLAQLRHRPDVTVYVDAPLDVRVRRIRNRSRSLIEAQANELSAADLRVLARREDVARRLIREERHRFLVLDNGRWSIEEGAKEIVAVVEDRLARAASEGAS
jgi:thymidylate kinase